MPNVCGRTYRHVLDDVRARFAAGERVDDIARELDLSATTVHSYTVHLPQRNAMREARRVRVLACLDAGLDVRATAANVPCQISYVVRIIKSARAAEPLPVRRALAAPPETEAPAP